jgi:hypothetical protein
MNYWRLLESVQRICNECVYQLMVVRGILDTGKFSPPSPPQSLPQAGRPHEADQKPAG